MSNLCDHCGDENCSKRSCFEADLANAEYYDAEAVAAMFRRTAAAQAEVERS